MLAADREHEETDHPVAKPIKVWEWLMQRGTTAAGQTVFDPFCGSGTTIIAAQLLGRVAFGLELEPRWVDSTLARFQRLTGVKPVLESTGEAHDFTV